MELSKIYFRGDTTAYQGLHQIKITFNLDLDLWVIITLRCSRRGPEGQERSLALKFLVLSTRTPYPPRVGRPL